MALSLDPILRAAQDGKSHKIIVELKQTDGESIPFDGEYLTTETENEQHPNCITHGTGRICAVYVFGDDKLKYAYTDVSRETWEGIVTLDDTTNLGLGAAVTIVDCNILELTNATIGLIFTCYDGTNYYLRQTILSVTGTVASNALIATYAIATYPEVTSPYCILMANGTYLLFYIVDTSASISTLYKRTSADFSSWSAEASVTPTGISTSPKHWCSLYQIDNNDVFLLFDYENTSDITNCYYSISSDNGGTWAAAVAITSYTGTDLWARHPTAVQQATNTLHIVYDERQMTRFIDETTTDWPGGNADTTALHSYGGNIYMICNNSGAGTDALIAVVKVNIDSWTITGSWTTGTSPAFGAVYANSDLVWRVNGHERQYIVIGTTGGQVAVLDVDAGTINNYYFLANSTYSLTANTDWTPETSGGVCVTALAFAVISDNILYACLYHNDVTTRPIEIVSLDLNQVQVSDMWTVNQVYFGTNIFTETELDHLIDYGGSTFRIFRQSNCAVWSIETSGNKDDPGKLVIFDTSEDTWTVSVSYSGWSGGAATVLPYCGPLYSEYYNGCLYMTFPYQASYSQSANWEVYNVTAVNAAAKGYQGACTNGRYIYFAPSININPHGLALRFDTQGTFTDVASWTVYDTTIVNGNSEGFSGCVYDNSRYVFYVPYDYGVPSGQVTRYDTQGSFTDAASWEVYDMTLVNEDAMGYKNGVKGGNYIYYVPYYNDDLGYHGLCIRYNLNLGFSNGGSYETFDMTQVHPVSKGFKGAVFTGDHVYFIPYRYASGTHGHFTRYDVHKPFTYDTSWEEYDLETNISSAAHGYDNAVYDGHRYIYLVPYSQDIVGPFGLVIRYDSNMPFKDPDSYATFDTTTVDGDAKGFIGGCFDGRYLFLSPYWKATGVAHGHVARYDSYGEFTDPASWEVFDATGVNAAAKGFHSCIYADGHVYFIPYNTNGAFSGLFARFISEGSFGTGLRQGICKLDLAAGASYFIEPDWDTDYDDYKFSHIKKITGPDGDELLISGDYGLTRYNLKTGEWILYDNSSVPGMTPDDDDTNYFDIAFDPATNIIFAGKLYDASLWEGMLALSLEGFFSQPKYKINTYGEGAWSLGSAANIITGSTDCNAVLCLEPSTSNFYAFWTKTAAGEISVKWDKEFTDFDLTPYLVTDTDIVIERSIDNKPARLTFSLAMGHLFDEDNISSLYLALLKKGATLTLRVGEIVSGSNFFENQGTFVVKTKQVTYRRDVNAMPIMAVEAIDGRAVLEDMELITTSFYDGDYPETIIADILENKGGISSADIDITYIDNRTLLYCGWSETRITDIIASLCDRYGYFLRLTPANIYEVKKIDETRAVDHQYYDRSTLLEYSPDNNYSDYVNRIIVQSEERAARRIVYPEKEIQIVHGTIGWWQGNEEIKIPYSDDYSLQCLDPYPKIRYLTGNFLFSGGKLRWQLTADISNTFCTLKLIAPIMIDQLASALAVALGTDWIPIVGGAISAAGWIEILNILASVSNWSAIIIAKPLGFVRSSVQGTADDTAFQTTTGKTVIRTLEEPLAYTQSQCQIVAEHEMMITRLQRRRVTIRKIAHLQDEEGDIIEVIHPISQDEVKLLITTITRRIRKPSKTDTSGGMYDTIEAWRIT